MDGASMDSASQFFLNSDCKKHYHWQCSCALHNLTGQCGHTTPSAQVGVKKKKAMQSIRSMSDLNQSGNSINSSKRPGHGSMGSLLELLKTDKSQEEVRRDAAKRGGGL